MNGCYGQQGQVMYQGQNMMNPMNAQVYMNNVINDVVNRMNVSGGYTPEQMNMLRVNEIPFRNDVWNWYSRNNFQVQDQALRNAVIDFAHKYMTSMYGSVNMNGVMNSNGCCGGYGYSTQRNMGYGNNANFYPQNQGSTYSNIYNNCESPIDFPRPNENKPASVTQEQEAVPVKTNHGATDPNALGKMIAGKNFISDGPIKSRDLRIERPKITLIPHPHVSEEAKLAYAAKMQSRKMEFFNARKATLMHMHSVPEPVTSPEAAIHHATDSGPEYMEGQVINEITYDEMSLEKSDFETGKRLIEECGELYERVKEKRTEIYQIIRKLNESGNLGQELKRKAYELFNQRLTTVMIKQFASDGNFQILNPVDSDVKFNELFTGICVPDEFKEEPEKYDGRLADCIINSFGAMFDTSESKHYVDIKDDLEQQYVLANDTFGYKFTNCLCGRVVKLFSADDSNLKEEIRTQLSKVFPFTIRKQIVLHNLEFDDIIGWNVPGIQILRRSISSVSLESYLQETNSSSVITINTHDKTQLKHPLMLSTTFDGSVVWRRI